MAVEYFTEVWGGCMGPSLPDGTRLLVDPEKEIAPLSLVTIVLREGKGPWDKFMREAWREAMGNDDAPNCMGKVFLRRGTIGGRDAVMVAQLYPPTVGLIAVDEIEAMHAISGFDGRGEIRITEPEEWALIAWAGQGAAAMPPINPDWRRRPPG